LCAVDEFERRYERVSSVAAAAGIVNAFRRRLINWSNRWVAILSTAASEE
jgi:hypothetical protein